MTATLDVLPGTRLIAVPRLTADQRAIRLARLAADVIEQPGRLPASDVAILLAAYASDSLHGDKLTGAWQEYLSAVVLEEDTDDGTVTWQEIEPRLTCGDRAEIAKEMTRANARDALHVLVNGEKELGGSKLTAIAESPILTEPGIYDIPEDVYHADPVPGGSLSSTGVRRLLPPSCPARFRYEQQHPPQPTESKELGTAAHKLVLGTGAEIVKVDADSWRTNAAKEAAAEARGRGAVPLLPGDYATVQAMAAAIRSHRLASALLSTERGGHPEQSLFAVDDYTGIWCRARLDWMPDPASARPVIADYKTAQSADPGSFAKSLATYGYHVQEFFYRRLYEQVTGVDAEFVFIVQEKTPPYVVTVCQLDAASVRAGGEATQRALEIYRDCTEAGVWPGDSDEIEQISLPRWAMPRESY